MTHSTYLNYAKINGQVVLFPQELPDDIELIELDDIEFEGEPQWENSGIGDYEFWGSREHDSGQDYVSFEQNGNPTWDKSKYNDDENEAIELYTKTEQFENFCDEFCRRYAEGQ
jgi:hypothetical protein